MAHTAAKAHPLAWPKDRPRQKYRQSSKFGDKTVAKAYEALKSELGRLGAQYIVISTNIPLKTNGEPYSDPGRLPDPGAAAYFQMGGKSYALSCDKWVGVEENLYALAKHIEAMRGMERWGVGSVEQAFAGFKELASDATDQWWHVLGVLETATLEQIETAYKTHAKRAHPDVPGGSHIWMQKLNVARDQALTTRGKHGA